MTTVSTILTFDSLVKKIKTKHSISSAWSFTQNVADASLYLWRFNGDEPIPLGVILKTVSNTNNTIELLARKKEGRFVRYELQVRYMERKQSKLALGAGLLSAENNQIVHETHGRLVVHETHGRYASMRLMDVRSSMDLVDDLTSMRFMDVRSSLDLLDDLTSMRLMDFRSSMRLMDIHRLLEKAMQSTENYKLLEREVIKEALSAGFFGVMAKSPSHYLPHTELVQKFRGSQGGNGVEEDDVDEEEIQEDIRQSKKHEKDRMAAAKKAHKDKGKSQPKKKTQSSSQAPKKKLLSSSIAVERSFRESQNDGGKRKREREAMNVPAPPSQKHLKIILTPPSKKHHSGTPPVAPKKTLDPVEETSSEEEENESEGHESGARVAEAKEESDSPSAKKVPKRGSKLKTLKEMEPAADSSEVHFCPAD
ncbi:hypothetical protein R1sor_025932 [Riccia sorocarpa]|uniref:Uncharacterized protein n=1 Tax=Riccia sorocarpa TaxID=122646 RepID=A0ABD3GDZ0_9MARC